MPETIREVAVTIEVDTNKQSRRKKLALEKGETLATFQARVATAVSSLMEELA